MFLLYNFNCILFPPEMVWLIPFGNPSWSSTELHLCKNKNTVLMKGPSVCEKSIQIKNKNKMFSLYYLHELNVGFGHINPLFSLSLKTW